MIDHIMINVEDFEKSKAFYKAVLAPLGYIPIWEFQGWAGFSADGNQIAAGASGYMAENNFFLHSCRVP